MNVRSDCCESKWLIDWVVQKDRLEEWISGRVREEKLKSGLYPLGAIIAGSFE